MVRIVSISYDKTLLRARHLILEAGGYKVITALGRREAIDKCGEPADLVIIGHSIPKKDKVAMIECFRVANPRGVTFALTRAGEERLREVDVYINPGDPDDLLRAIGHVLDPESERRKRPHR